jgi:hypothetical protein
MVDELAIMADNQVSRPEIERVLRGVNYDLDAAVEDILSHAAQNADSSKIRERLEQAKPNDLPTDQAMDLYRNVCGGDIEAAVKLLREM